MFWRTQKSLDRGLYAAAIEGDTDKIARLLDKGARLETRNGDFGLTALNAAAYKGQLKAVCLLLDRGADINTRDKVGDTPLICAVLGTHTSVIRELLGRGADPETRNNNGKTAADKAGAAARDALGLPPLVTPVQQQPAPAAQAAQAGPGPDEIIVLRPFGDRVLQEVFNFAARERISILRKGADGPIEAMTRESFSVIDDKTSLHMAYALYASRGGAVPETEVFPAALGKGLTLPKGP